MSQPVPEPTPEPAPFVPPASQVDLDRVIGERLAREREKTKDYADLKRKAEQWDEAEAKNRTELENAQRSAADAKARADVAEQRAIRAEVAADKGVPAGHLSGATKEELEASADALLAWRGEPKTPSTIAALAPGAGSATEKSVAAGAAMFQERRKPSTKE